MVEAGEGHWVHTPKLYTKQFKSKNVKTLDTVSHHELDQVVLCNQ